MLQLAPDGTLTGVYERTRPTIRGSAEYQSGTIQGRWSLTGGELCFEGAGLEYAGRSCFKLSKGGYSKNEWAGTESGSGDVWQFFVYPAGR